MPYRPGTIGLGVDFHRIQLIQKTEKHLWLNTGGHSRSRNPGIPA
jgi:hypothetical protein